MYKIFFFILLFSISVFSQNLTRVFILSEGGFISGSAALSLFNPINNNFNQNIFSPGNLGLYPDGILYHNGFIYLTEQGNFGGQGKIYKLDTLGNVLHFANAGVNPYSLAIANNKIYVTNGPSSKVTVLNLSNLSFIKTINVGVYPQEILSYQNKIYVANNSLWGGASDSTVSVIDANLDSVVSTIVVKKDPSSLAISRDEMLLIGCPGNTNNGVIYKVNPNTNQIVLAFNIPTYGFSKDLNVDKNSENIFFISFNNDIVRYNQATSNVGVVYSSVNPNNYFYGYAYEHTRKQHYILDAKNFTVSGSLLIADSSGNLLNTFTTGIAPRRVLFHYAQPSTNIDDAVYATDYKLFQNYPNPFNPSTTIRWQMPNSAYITLKVYDLLGNEVAKLVDEHKNSGTHNINFNGSNNSSGIYFYELKVNDGNETHTLRNKMTLIK